MKIDKIIAFESMVDTRIEVIFEHNNKEYIYNFLTETFAEQFFDELNELEDSLVDDRVYL